VVSRTATSRATRGIRCRDVRDRLAGRHDVTRLELDPCKRARDRRRDDEPLAHARAAVALDRHLERRAARDRGLDDHGLRDPRVDERRRGGQRDESDDDAFDPAAKAAARFT
jgi:hypothetical protein